MGPTTTFLLNSFRNYVRMKVTYFAIGSVHSVISWQAKCFLLSNLSFQAYFIYLSGSQIIHFGALGSLSEPSNNQKCTLRTCTALYFSMTMGNEMVEIKLPLPPRSRQDYPNYSKGPQFTHLGTLGLLTVAPKKK